jgi:PDZ domain
MHRREFIAGLGSAAAWPVMARAQQDDRVGALDQRSELSGIGIDLAMENGLIKVVTAINELPAAKAGIMDNDIITQLDDEQVQGLTLKQAAEKMRGPVGTKIKLMIIRKGHDKPIEVSVTRDVIRMSSRVVAPAQQQPLQRIGWLVESSHALRLIPDFLDGLTDAGYVLGRNVAIEFRFAQGHNDRLPALVADLVRRGVTVIAASDISATEAVQAATTIPVVWMSYQGNNVDSYRTAGFYVGRILKGETLIDLPLIPPR